MTWSDDDGASWGGPVDMTQHLVPEDYAWDAVGPGIGIQTMVGPGAGRLVIPAIGRNIYSDDNGRSWRYQRIHARTSEGTIVELANGVLMRNDRAVRSLWKQHRRRMVSFGSIDAESWSPWIPHAILLDPASQGSVLRYTSANPSRILFLNSASTKTRTTMRVRISYDEGLSWPIQRRLPEPTWAPRALGGYSSMVKSADSMVGALVEVNDDRGDTPNSHRSIVFQKFNLPWILDGTPE